MKENKRKIKEDVENILNRMRSGDYYVVIYPAVGVGVAGLPLKAPLTHAYILEQIKRVKS